MDGWRSQDSRSEVTRTLRALGGRGTMGDLILTTGRPRRELEEVLDALLAEERVQVVVSETAVLTYRLHDRRGPDRRRSADRDLPADSHEWRAAPATAGARFDRKTLRLIRTRQGVLSVAELVEHTGLRVAEAAAELDRLARLYGGEGHPSWDGHVVYAFPELMASAHGDFSVREPRPAWVRAEDPMRRTRRSHAREAIELTLSGAGIVACLAAPWVALTHPAVSGSVAAVAGTITLSAAGLLVLGRRVLDVVSRSRTYRFRHPSTLRRYALGYVYETALKGKGVVSLDRTVKYLQARAGRRTVSRTAVEKALRQLAEEFDAPITEGHGDVFFGFRNVKRQFLASHVERVRLQLERKAGGEILFDSGDPPLVAAARELAAFDQSLFEHQPPRDV